MHAGIAIPHDEIAKSDQPQQDYQKDRKASANDDLHALNTTYDPCSTKAVAFFSSSSLIGVHLHLSLERAQWAEATKAQKEHQIVNQ